MMSNNLRRMAFSLLVGSLAVVAVAPPADAARGTYSPDVEESDDVIVVDTEVLGSNEQVPNPLVTDPGAENSGANNPPLVVPQVNPVSDPAPAPASDIAPEKAGVTLPRTGTTILPLVRVGTAILALGLGLVALARRRRAAIA